MDINKDIIQKFITTAFDGIEDEVLIEFARDYHVMHGRNRALAKKEIHDRPNAVMYLNGYLEGIRLRLAEKTTGGKKITWNLNGKSQA